MQRTIKTRTIMTKQSFPIPEGCKAVTVEQVGNQIITTFETEFKRGDVLICYDETRDNNADRFVFIFKDIVPDSMGNGMCAYVRLSPNRLRLDYEYMFASYWDVLRHATPEEAQRLWDALAKEGKQWNPETMQVEEIKKEIPRSNHLSFYYFLSDLDFSINDCMENIHLQDGMRHKAGNYFLTKEQAQRAADKIKQALAEFWKDELK